MKQTAEINVQQGFGFFYINEVIIQIQVNVKNSVVAGVYPVHCNFYSQTKFICSNLYLY